MSEVNIIAIIYPASGKVERLRELMKGMCETVHKKEDYTLRYMMTETLEKDPPEMVMVETYKDKAGADKHTTEAHFKELFKAFGDEKLLAKEPYLAQTVTKLGFDRDRNLM